MTAGEGVSLVDGDSFCTSRASGDLVGGTDGLYVAGRRVLSRCALAVNGQAVVPVGCHLDDPAAATFVARAGHPSGGPGPIVVRRRFLGEGMRDDVELRNPGDEATYVEVEVALAAD
ncbi:MAG TPA: glycogen debranching N-terminal domain-containing protein, partial [Acidimicrobiales bacterium]